jgi:hypothetical protein
MFRETIKITKKHRKWFRETRVNSKKSGFVGVSNSHLFGFAGVVNSKLGPTLTLPSVSLCGPIFLFDGGAHHHGAMRVHEVPIMTPHDTVLLGSSPRQLQTKTRHV